MGQLNRPKLIFNSFLLAGAVYFSFVWWFAIRTDATGNIYLGPTTLWGDWALHFTMGSAMAFRDLFLKTSPLVIDAPFHYPYLVNLISALLIKAGTPFFAAFFVPSFLLSLAMISVLAYFYRAFFKSEITAVLASLIFLLNGGLGFIPYFINHGQKFATRLDSANIVYENILRSIWIPQRSFQLGLPMGLLALYLLWTAFISKERFSIWKVPLAGLLTGLLPIAHAHSFIAVTLIAGCWTVGDLLQNWKNRVSKLSWLLFWATVFIVAQPLVQGYFQKGTGVSSFGFAPGWIVFEKGGNWFHFWLNNWGFTPMLAVAGAFLWVSTGQPTDRKKYALFAAPFFILFALANLIKFQAWIWDNTKILAWVSIGFSGFAAVAIQWFFSQNKNSSRLVGVLLFGVTVLAGGLDAARLLRPSLNQNLFYTQEELELAGWVKANTPPDAVWLTGEQHNNWLYNLTGRQALLVYEGWLWTHGYQYKQVRDDLKDLFKDPQREELLTKYRIRYAAIGPKEMRAYKIDSNKFKERFKLILKTENYFILELVAKK